MALRLWRENGCFCRQIENELDDMNVEVNESKRLLKI